MRGSSSPSGTEATADPPVRPSSLRERVRAESSRANSVSGLEAQAAPGPALVTPIRREVGPSASPTTSLAPEASVEVARIVDLWPQVRSDVKALNRRIEALLSEVDPVAINGKQITLAVPYPFHRDKLNTDDVRETVSGVLSRLLGHDVSLLCVLRSEFMPVSGESQAIASAPRAAAEESVTSNPDEEERARVRLKAAINIFDAEEIGELDLTGLPVTGQA